MGVAGVTNPPSLFPNFQFPVMPAREWPVSRNRDVIKYVACKATLYDYFRMRSRNAFSLIKPSASFWS